MKVVRDPANSGVVGEQYVTVRNGRYVVPVRTAAAWTFEGVVQDRSQSDETVFVEPLFAVELNNRLLLASKTEEAEERRVRAELTARIREHTPALAALEEALAGVDALGAAAAFARRARVRSTGPWRRPGPPPCHAASVAPAERPPGRTGRPSPALRTARVGHHGTERRRQDRGAQDGRTVRAHGAGGALRTRRRGQSPAVLPGGAGGHRRRAVDRA